MVIIMIKRHQIKRNKRQKDLMEYYEAKYLVPRYVSKLDLAVVTSSDDFPQKMKKDRCFNNAVSQAKSDLALLHFFMIHLKPRYRLKIMQSQEFQNMLTQILDISETKFYLMTKEEQEQLGAFTTQVFNYCITNLGRTIPPDFVKTFNHLAEPLNDLLEGMYEYSRKNKLTDVPKFQKSMLSIA